MADRRLFCALIRVGDIVQLDLDPLPLHLRDLLFADNGVRPVPAPRLQKLPEIPDRRIQHVPHHHNPQKALKIHGQAVDHTEQKDKIRRRNAPLHKLIDEKQIRRQIPRKAKHGAGEVAEQIPVMDFSIARTDFPQIFVIFFQQKIQHPVNADILPRRRVHCGVRNVRLTPGVLTDLSVIFPVNLPRHG